MNDLKQFGDFLYMASYRPTPIFFLCSKETINRQLLNSTILLCYLYTDEKIASRKVEKGGYTRRDDDTEFTP